MKQAAPPLVSVIIPAFNAERFLPDALNSLLVQTHVNWEAIIVDDGSIDQTAAIADEYAKKDSRFRWVRQPNRGVGSARNRAIAEARGEYIAPLDADDIWLPEKLEKQVACLERADESYGFCYCWTKTLDEDGSMTEAFVHWPVEGEAFYELVFRNAIASASVPLFRASALKAVGGYRTREDQNGAQGCEDWDLSIRLAEKSRIGEVPEYLVGYRFSDSNMSTNTTGMAQSYECAMSELRRRNPNLPRKLLRWSAGHFYLYLLNNCYFTENYAACFGILKKVVTADPVMLLSPTLYRVVPMSALRILLGRKFLQRYHKHGPGIEEGWTISSLFWLPISWIEKRRWRALGRMTK